MFFIKTSCSLRSVPTGPVIVVVSSPPTGARTNDDPYIKRLSLPPQLHQSIARHHPKMTEPLSREPLKFLQRHTDVMSAQYPNRFTVVCVQYSHATYKTRSEDHLPHSHDPIYATHEAISMICCM